MSFRLAIILCCFIFLNIYSKQTIGEEFIEFYTNNLTIEWQIFPIMTCGNQTIMYHVLFQCSLLNGSIEILDKICLYNKTFYFNNASCSIKKPRPVTPDSTIYQCKDENFIGINCDIPNNPCYNLELCQNDGHCVTDENLPYEYMCQCPLDYSGVHCEIDNRICKNNTCWHDGTCRKMQEIVSLVNETTFYCDCKAGYDGTYCETRENMCENITCANDAVCFSSYPTWTCVCLDSSLYYGTYCEYESTSLVVRQVLSKSFASIAITAIILVFLFVIIMDILKYVFKLDPVDHERQLIKFEKEEKKRKKKHKNPTEKHPLMQPYYIS